MTIPNDRKVNANEKNTPKKVFIVTNRGCDGCRWGALRYLLVLFGGGMSAIIKVAGQPPDVMSRDRRTIVLIWD